MKIELKSCKTSSHCFAPYSRLTYAAIEWIDSCILTNSYKLIRITAYWIGQYCRRSIIIIMAPIRKKNCLRICRKRKIFYFVRFPMNLSHRHILYFIHIVCSMFIRSFNLGSMKWMKIFSNSSSINGHVWVSWNRLTSHTKNLIDDLTILLRRLR